MCSLHYDRWHLDHADPCSIDGCEKPAESRGWCQMHYCRWRTHGDALYAPPTAQERYVAFVDRRGDDDCWLWTGSQFKNDGYGRFAVDHKWVRAHRFGWELAHGPIPEGLLVCHTCDVPLCQNPRHWFLGTNADNLADMASKGRSPTRQPGHAAVKLDADSVRAIRARYAEGGITHRELAALYGVSGSAISLVVRRKNWAHVT